MRITLRIPGDLHAKLVDAAASSSMNAEIIGRLEASFELDARDLNIEARIERLTQAMEQQQQMIQELLRDRSK